MHKASMESVISLEDFLAPFLFIYLFKGRYIITWNIFIYLNNLTEIISTVKCFGIGYAPFDSS